MTGSTPTMTPSSPRTDVDVLVVGGGIAGACAAYCAARAGRRVTLVDDGRHRASGPPIALVNPLRGHTGRLVAGGVEGLHATLMLIDALRRDGHAIEAERGLWRPLVDVAPPARERAFWDARIASSLAFEWHAVAPASLGLAAPVPALFLRDAGWVVPAGLLDALIAASGATVVRGRVDGLEPLAGAAFAVRLAGQRIVARSLLWCGGAFGASLLDAREERDGPVATRNAVNERVSASYKPGSLLALDALLTDGPMSFGLYVAPWSSAGTSRTLVGPTREGSQGTFPEGAASAEAIGHLGDRVARTFGTTIAPYEAWRGVRLARLSANAATALAGVPTLTALGSRGFLMAPWHAAAWARSL